MTIDVLATGYPSIDYILPVSHSPAIGETALLKVVPDDMKATYGGCGLNVAVALAKLGFKCGVAVILGEDGNGYRYRALLREYRIDTSDVISLPRTLTSRSYLFRNPNGEYQNFFLPGAADEWNGRLALRSLRETRMALVTVGPYRYNAQFVQLVKNAGVPLMWQLKPDIFAYPIDGMRDFAAASTYILMNHIEAGFVGKALGLKDVSELVNDTTKVVVVTKGPEGCTVYTREGAQKIRAVPPDKLVDTVGAGDAFTAGFLAGLIRNYGVQVAGQLGSVMASFVLENIGCQTNLPDWRKMEARYVTHFGPITVAQPT